jgi:hypothetical protein
MRLVALLGLTLLLSGCAGEGEFMRDVFSLGANRNRPFGNSENMRRVTGLESSTEPLTPEQGNIWPQPVTTTPTLQDLQKQGNVEQTPPPPNLAPFLPDHRQPRPSRPGSSTPPGSNEPALPPELQLPPQPAPPVTSNPTPPRAGQVVPTSRGPGVTSGGTSGYQTLTTPQGTAIVVPNGNGTSTMIRPDGTVETIPTPR